MLKLKLKRKISGKAIKKDKRNKALHPAKEFNFFDDNGNIITKTVPVYVQYENKGLYRKNRVQKRHVENPTVYEGEEPLRCGIRNIRVPRKCRKTAWKRFYKAFPYVTFNSKGQMLYDPSKDKKNKI